MKRCSLILFAALIILFIPSCSSKSNEPIRKESIVSLFGTSEIYIDTGETYEKVLVFVNNETPIDKLNFVSEDDSIVSVSAGKQLSNKSFYLNIQGLSKGSCQVYIEIPDEKYVSEKFTVFVNSSNVDSESETISPENSDFTSSLPETEIQTDLDTVEEIPSNTEQINAIEIVNITTPVKRGAKAALSIKALPSTEYSIKVYYSSSVSSAKGLENKSTDSNGNLTWEWKVGGSTAPGNHKIVISGGGDTKETYFETIK